MGRRNFPKNMFLCRLHAFLFLFSSAFVLSIAFGQLHGSQTIHVNALGSRKELQDDISLYGARRSLLADENKNKNYSLILAAERTHRKDPFNGYEYYTGGWDLFNKGYIRSVAYTGVPALLIAAGWLIGFGLFLLLYCCCCCCGGRKTGGYSGILYALSLTILVLLTVGAIIGCGLLYQGQGGLRSSLKGVVRYINSVADDLLNKLVSLEHALTQLKDVKLGNVGLPPDVLGSIDTIDKVIASSANIPKVAARAFEKFISANLNLLGLFLILVATVMLVFTLLGSSFSILGLRPLVFLLIVVGWILVIVTLILSSVSLLVHNVIADSCIAVDEWLKNPMAHTAMDRVLPCYDTQAAQTVISQGKNATHQTVGMMNRFITDVANKDLPLPAQQLPMQLNRPKSPLIPLVCDPYNPDYTNRICAPGEVTLKDAPQEWSKYKCQVSEIGICNPPGRLTPDMYDQMVQTLNLTNSVNDLIPYVANLTDCKMVRETFSNISQYHCPGLRKYSYRIFTGLGSISFGVMLSLFAWLFYGRQRQKKRASAVNASTQDLLAAQRGHPYRF